jgi:two-component system cell cycle sensor histidine kinase/response regulator CckA
LAKGKILVMDDEELVRTVAGKMLEFLGYQAVLARNGEEAINLYQVHRDNGQPFDAVILDWLVPDGMDGVQTMESLLRIDPTAKGILSSGFGEQDRDGHKISAGFSGNISKPYELKTLGSVIEAVLGKHEAA